MILYIIWFVILCISLLVLIKSSDYFVDYAEKIGLSLGISRFVIGATIIALGTSLPELVSGIIAVYVKSSEIVIGNVVGSNVANIFLILGVSILFFKNAVINGKDHFKDILILIFTAILITITIWDNEFVLYEGIIFIVLFSLYLVYSFVFKKEDIISIDENEENKTGNKSCKKVDIKHIIALISSCFFIYIGANYTIEAVVELSKLLSIGKEIIAITVVALGTSLPELTVSISASKKGQFEIVIGNIIGSNIFNTLAIMGIPCLIGSITVPKDIIYFSIPLMLLASISILLISFMKKLNKIIGIIFLFFYLVFISLQFV